MADEFLATAAAVVLASIAGIFSACYLVVRRVRRSLVVARVRLAKQRFLSRSRPRRELAGMRANVVEVTRGTGAIIEMMNERGSSAELMRLHDRFQRLSATLGRQLEVLSHEPDDRVLDAALDQMRLRAERVVQVASDVRVAASLLSDDAIDFELAALGKEVRREVTALTYGREVLGRQSATPV